MFGKIEERGGRLVICATIDLASAPVTRRTWWPLRYTVHPYSSRHPIVGDVAELCYLPHGTYWTIRAANGQVIGYDHSPNVPGESEEVPR